MMNPPSSARSGTGWLDNMRTNSMLVTFDGDGDAAAPQPGLQLLQASTLQSVATSGGWISSRPAFPWFQWRSNHPVVETENLIVKQR
jgi:hypothetical protein